MIAIIAMMIVMVMLVINVSSFLFFFRVGVGVLFSLLCLLLVIGGCVHFSILFLLHCKQCPL